jgi:hypothetical protein
MNAEDISWVEKFVKRFNTEEKIEFWKAVNKYMLPVFSDGGDINEAISKASSELYIIWNKDNNIK